MSIQNPSNLYSGNSVALNSTPFTDYAIKQLADKEAKNEALDKYFAQQNARITPEGMHHDEIGTLLNKKNEYQNYYMANKDKIHKNDIGALSKVYQLQNEMQGIVANSNRKVDDLKTMNHLRSNPNTAHLLDDGTMQMMSNAGAPIYKPDGTSNAYDAINNPHGYKPFDEGSVNFNPKEYTQAEQDLHTQRQTKNNYPHTQLGITTTPNKTDKTGLSDIITSTFGLTPEQKQQYFESEKLRAVNDPRLVQTHKAEVNNMFLKDGKGGYVPNPAHEQEFNQLNDTFHQVYPDKNISTPEEYFAAQSVAPHFQDTAKSISRADFQAQERLRNAERLQLQRNSQTFSHNEHQLGMANSRDIAKNAYIPPPPVHEGLMSRTKTYTTNPTFPTKANEERYLPTSSISPEEMDYLGNETKNGKSTILPMEVNGELGFPVDENGNVTVNKVVGYNKAKINGVNQDVPIKVPMKVSKQEIEARNVKLNSGKKGQDLNVNSKPTTTNKVPNKHGI